jgi:hypothetical protein
MAVRKRWWSALADLMSVRAGAGGDLSTDPMLETQLAALRPRLVPTSYLAGPARPDYRIALALPDHSLTWVLLDAHNVYTLVTDAMVQRWEAAGVDWQARAIRNLGPRSGRDSVTLFTKGLPGPDGRPLFAMATHRDGLGISRLFAEQAVAHHFPHGYRVAIPTMQTGMVLSNAAGAEVEQQFTELVECLWSESDIALIKDVFAPELLRPAALPEAVT